VVAVDPKARIVCKAECWCDEYSWWSASCSGDPAVFILGWTVVANNTHTHSIRETCCASHLKCCCARIGIGCKSCVWFVIPCCPNANGVFGRAWYSSCTCIRPGVACGYGYHHIRVFSYEPVYILAFAIISVPGRAPRVCVHPCTKLVRIWQARVHETKASLHYQVCLWCYTSILAV